MRLRYLAPLLPLAAIWTYVFATSASQLHGLMPNRPAERQPTAVSQRPLPAPPVSSRSAAVGPENASREAATEVAPDPEAVAATDPGAPVPLPVAAFVPPNAALGAGEAAAAEQEPLEHPDITDPKMRRLLAPAWAD
ncbi:MAG TPA: hypothetical protein VF200_00810 [Woeseiaceae bacterium]